MPESRPAIRNRWSVWVLGVSVLLMIGLLAWPWGLFRRLQVKLVRHTVESRVRQYGVDCEQRMRPWFEAVGLQYPGSELAMLCLKQPRRVELYGRESDSDWRLIKIYPILAASGDVGPKLSEGDRQVPEGVYRIESLNPNSRHHLALRLNYPNEFDRQMAQRDGRTNLGGDIMIHGGSSSIGCLAVGDLAAEELFVLAALVGCEHVQVVLSPVDLRDPKTAAPIVSADWSDNLYLDLREALQPFPAAGNHRN